MVPTSVVPKWEWAVSLMASQLPEEEAVDLIHRLADRFDWNHWLIARATNRG